MAWDFNGSDQYVRFTMNATLQAATGGPMTLIALVHLDATTDGAVICTLAGTTARQYMEIFGTWNYGTSAGTRTGPAGTTGAWYIVIISKNTGTVAPEYTLIPLATGIPVSGTLTGGGVTLGDGVSPGATGQIQVAQFGNSASERVDGRIAATAIYTAYKAQAAREALTTWALWLAAAGLQWAVKYDTLSTLVDASGLGGGETGRFGATMTLSADPAGFFGGTSVALGTATSTDSAQALARTKSRALGIASGTDSAQALTRRKSRTLGVATTADASQTLARRKGRTLGIVSSVDASQALTRRKSRTLGIPSTVDSAQALVAVDGLTLGIASTVDSARPLTVSGPSGGGAGARRVQSSPAGRRVQASRPGRATSSTPAGGATQ